MLADELVVEWWVTERRIKRHITVIAPRKSHLLGSAETLENIELAPGDGEIWSLSSKFDNGMYLLPML